MFSSFFVRRPVLLGDRHSDHDGRYSGDPHAARSAVSGCCAASGQNQRHLYRCVGADAGKQRHPVVIEQQLTGLDNLLYFSSTSSSDGEVNITVTFEAGNRPGYRPRVQVQNKVQQAESRLPTEVTQSGVTVVKSQSNFLLIMGLYDKTDRATSSDIADWLVSNMQDPLARVNGVGSLQVFGAEYAMRIWMDPNKLASYSLMPSDVESAIEAQNVQVSAGKIGALPSSNSQQLTATVRAQSRLQTVAQFRGHHHQERKQRRGSTCERCRPRRNGQRRLQRHRQLNGHPAAGLAVMLAPGANALDTATLVKDKIAEYRHSMPQGYDVAYPKDSTEFIKISIEDVVKTLIGSHRTGGLRDVPVPAKYPRYADSGAGGAGGAAGYVWRAGAVWLLH